jgi:hypothetical protein
VGLAPPTAGAGLVREQKWRKNFQNMIYTHVCRPNTCPTYGAESYSSRPKLSWSARSFDALASVWRQLSQHRSWFVSRRSRDCDKCAISLPHFGRASCRFASVTVMGLATQPRGHHRDVCEDAGHSAKARLLAHERRAALVTDENIPDWASGR